MKKTARGKSELTTPAGPECPAEQALRSIAGKWKPQILRLATEGPLRFNALSRALADSNRQALTNALRELESDGLLLRTVLRLKPLHVEYTVTPKGEGIITLLRSLESEG
jgi:DNA-binding HxlR family transcriptional regulator